MWGRNHQPHVALLQEMADMEPENRVPLLVGQLEEARSYREEELKGDEVGVESLDYEPIHSLVYAQTKKGSQQRHFYGYTGLTFAKWLITILIGLLVGVVAYIVESSQEVFIMKKRDWTQETIDEGLKLPFVFLGYAAFGIALVLLSSCLVLLWAPAAAGGGVTLVMAYLNGIDIPSFFEFRTLVTKIVGTICTISSGLPIGQEGPMVHIGAAIASSLTWMHGRFPTHRKDGSRRYASPYLQTISKFTQKAWPFDFHNDKDRREFISAGTAAGLAAAFGAPIGGVLFSLEEASSFWSRKVMWRSLLCTTMATMILAWLNDRDFTLSLPGGLAFHGASVEVDLNAVPLIMVTAGSLGVLGALLNTTHGWLSPLRAPSKQGLLRVLEACCITFIAVGTMFLLSHFFGRCLPIQHGQQGEEYWFRYTCPKTDPNTGISYYNDLATLYFGVPHETIKQLFAMGYELDTYFSMRSLILHSMSFFVLFNLAYGVATPGGIFMPSIMVGASFGAFLGRVFQLYFPEENIQPGLHALVGATAMLGGVFRSSLSLVVIMMEGTGGLQYLLPAIIAIYVGNWVAHHIHHEGAYEADLERLGDVRFLQSEPPRHLIPVTAAEMMAPNVITLTEIISVSDVVKILKNTTHNGFPVIRHTEANDDGQLVGLILRHQLLLLLEQRALIEVDSEILRLPLPERFTSRDPRVTKEHVYLEHAMRVYHHCHNPHRRYLSSRPGAVDELELDDILQEHPTTNGVHEASNGTNDSKNKEIQESSESTKPEHQVSVHKRELALDLRYYMNRAPVTVRAECSAQRAYIIFRTLGLRHLCVTDSSNSVIGMITRKDIAQSAHHQAEHSVSKIALERQESDGSSYFGDRATKDILFSLP
ncbi:chloride channel protein CLC-d [Physcomitrium patens]|uniref:Chloride channel protein n=2 Tax=Physcomitrium patens TaxID=3218 RepID=A0A7I4EQL7_PHYPA|nr:chloride channel protein B-like isoform X2 [Physcomitrium patens]|eukprot:XP_024384497.1 chloride channel protein B-like isoform X2 [Physcomitrella patens]